MQITITFEQEKLDGTAAAKLALAVKRSVSWEARGVMGNGAGSGGGPIVDTDGTVLGQWKAEHQKRKRAAA